MKCINKMFLFLNVLDKNELPAYARQYIKKETILTIYKTKNDYGVFTDKKLVLFDNNKLSKSISIIPYQNIESIMVTFHESSAELFFYMNSASSFHFNFINMKPNDKYRLRLLYTCMDKFINEQTPIQEDITKLMNNDVKLS